MKNEKAHICCDTISGDLTGICKKCSNKGKLKKCKEGNPEGKQLTVFEYEIKKCSNYMESEK